MKCPRCDIPLKLEYLSFSGNQRQRTFQCEKCRYRLETLDINFPEESDLTVGVMSDLSPGASNCLCSLVPIKDKFAEGEFEEERSMNTENKNELLKEINNPAWRDVECKTCPGPIKCNNLFPRVASADPNPSGTARCWLHYDKSKQETSMATQKEELKTYTVDGIEYHQNEKHARDAMMEMMLKYFKGGYHCWKSLDSKAIRRITLSISPSTSNEGILVGSEDGFFDFQWRDTPADQVAVIVEMDHFEFIRMSTGKRNSKGELLVYQSGCLQGCTRPFACNEWRLYNA